MDDDDFRADAGGEFEAAEGVLHREFVAAARNRIGGGR
jgi:hypothetical protein